MDTDGPLKLLFQKYAADLLSLTGDVGATVHRAGPVELHALERRVDCVVHLERDGETYYRHVEFQGRADPDMAARCFRYNSQLLLLYGAPVVTSVLYLLPPKPRQATVFRVVLRGREVNRWRFDEICLWELEAREALAHGAPGLLALIPLMSGGQRSSRTHEALVRASRGPWSEAGDVLLALAGQYYTFSELTRIVGRDRMIQSSLYAEGHAEGRLDAERELCVALVRKHHAAIVERAIPVIERCQDPVQLKEWVLVVSDLSDSDFLRLLEA